MTTAMSGSMLQMATSAQDIPSHSKTKAEAPQAVTYPMPDPPSPTNKILPQVSPAIIHSSTKKGLWPTSLLASLAIHGAVAAALMINWSFLRSSDDAPPPAAMVVELAVMPASPPVQPTEIPPGPKQVEAAPKPTPLDKMKFDPPPQVDPALKPEFALPVKQQANPTETQVVAKDARGNDGAPGNPGAYRRQERCASRGQ